MLLDITRYLIDENVYVVPDFIDKEAGLIPGFDLERIFRGKANSTAYPLRLSDNAKNIEWRAGQFRGEEVIYFLEDQFPCGSAYKIGDIKNQLARLKQSGNNGHYPPAYAAIAVLYRLVADFEAYKNCEHSAPQDGSPIHLRFEP